MLGGGEKTKKQTHRWLTIYFFFKVPLRTEIKQHDSLGSRNSILVASLFVLICEQNAEPLACLQSNVSSPPLRLV